jgi:hypothetical protein
MPFAKKMKLYASGSVRQEPEPLRRGKFATNFLRLKREFRSPISKASENSSTEPSACAPGLTPD